MVTAFKNSLLSKLYRRYAISFKFAMMALTVAVITYSLPRQVQYPFEYEIGQQVDKDMVAPFSFAIQKTRSELDQDRAHVLKAVLPVYQNHTKIPEKQLKAFLNELELTWKASGVHPTLKKAYQNAGLEILQKIYNKGIIILSKKYQQHNLSYSFVLLTNHVSRKLNTIEVFTSLKDASQYAEEEVKKLNLAKKQWLVSLIKNHLQANYIYDEHLTDKWEAEALSNISTTRGVVQKRELIAAKGTIITTEVYQKLESLKAAYERNTNSRGDYKVIFLGQLFLVSQVIILLVVFLYLFQKDVYQDNRKLSLIMLVITSMLLILSWAIKLHVRSLNYIPYCIVPIIIRILFNPRLALNIHLLVVLVAGFFVPNSYEFAFLQITSGIVAIYSTKNLLKRKQFLGSALLILCNYLVVFLSISLVRDASVSHITWIDLAPFVLSVLLTLLAYPLIYAFERMFGMTSDVTLIEITNINSKLLLDLSYKAPGTFHHSLQVANLAEAAIFKIGGNALLVRAGALYHDIGKMVNPEYFIENQSRTANPHNKLTYEQSARIIIEHVGKGIELARKHHIPEAVIDFIRTHHGDTLVDYFYKSFVDDFPEKFVDKETFKYPGPIPFSKETAVLMLADSAEAATRGIKEPNAHNISALIDHIIEHKLNQRQLVDSNITLKDIELIKVIFKNMLMSMYHVRTIGLH